MAVTVRETIIAALQFALDQGHIDQGEFDEAMDDILYCPEIAKVFAE